MSHLILIDELAVRDCVESNIYQSCHFEAGLALAKALSGNQTVATITPRIVPNWAKGGLYLLQSRVETGYLLISSKIFPSLNAGDSPKLADLDDVLHIFQRVCRFAMKGWNNMSFARSEKWVAGTDYGVVFPYPISSSNGFRIVVRKAYSDRRVERRHGDKHLFAFACGHSDAINSNSGHEQEYRKAFEELSAVRTSLAPTIQKQQEEPTDFGYHPLVLTNAKLSSIRFQNFNQWLSRLTIEQKRFVESADLGAQRVEGPAGTGKTLCLILRAYSMCERAREAGKALRVLFVAHSEATRSAISTMFDGLGEPAFHVDDGSQKLQSIELCTLQQWCGSFLGGKDVSNSQYLDQDALLSKEMRKLILSQDVVSKRIIDDPFSLGFLSPACRNFFTSETPDYISELLQHEIGVLIKGRASENLESYLELPPMSYCLPTVTSNDRRFVFSLYREYQKQLLSSGVFDTDDIVLSALGRLDTPIWRRRRAEEGYNAILIDETHLFNLNELSVFHYLLRNSGNPAIIFSIDRVQAPGERGITTKLVREVLTPGEVTEQEVRTNVVFRSSAQIVRLAEAVTASGASLFTTFENPLVNVSTVITGEDESLVSVPSYWRCQNDAVMCTAAAARARQLSNSFKCPISELLIVCTSTDLIELQKQYLSKQNIKYVEILQRGDLETVQRGVRDNAIILSHPDFVGGLEFKGVLIVGVDEGRIPPNEGVRMAESKHFVAFKACNRLYVTITRARLAAELFFSAERGQSSLLAHAIDKKVIELHDAKV